MPDDVSPEVPSAVPLSRSLSKSTPQDPILKPRPPPKVQVKNRAEDDISVQPHFKMNNLCLSSADDETLSTTASLSLEPECPKRRFQALPTEILEMIGGHAVGHLSPAYPECSGSQPPLPSWNGKMRHCRRKDVSDVALVSGAWRKIVQKRLFRHLKILGTEAALQECIDFFLSHTHLQPYVRHLHVLVPIWELRRGPQNVRSTPEIPAAAQGTVIRAFPGYSPHDLNATRDQVSHAFQLASKKATMEDVFGCAAVIFPDLCALTIEGGHCKHPPQIQYFNPTVSLQSSVSIGSSLGSLPSNFSYEVELSELYRLPILPTLKTLILKGAWNIIRLPSEVTDLIDALPKLTEFHCSYHAPKTMAYITLCSALKYNIPPRITHLNLELEGLYAKNASSLQKWRKLYPAWHICCNLGLIAPQLESLAYTGRVCHSLFDYAMDAAGACRDPCTRLKSIDVVVNNVCQDPDSHNDGTGVRDWPFIQAFEKLVIQALRALLIYTAVETIRIRYIDLDSPTPLSNPSFHLEGDTAWGLWSEEILASLRIARPNVRFWGLKDKTSSPGKAGDKEEEEKLTDSQKRSWNMEYYKAIGQGAL